VSLERYENARKCVQDALSRSNLFPKIQPLLRSHVGISWLLRKAVLDDKSKVFYASAVTLYVLMFRFKHCGWVITRIRQQKSDKENGVSAKNGQGAETRRG
jgi:hypothetical protein